MLREYQAKCRELTRWIEHSRSKRLGPYLKQRETLELIFALGIYYRWVIAPIVRTEQFLQRTSRLDVPTVRIGGRPLTADFTNSIKYAHGEFQRIASWFGLTEYFFAVTDVGDIVNGLVRLEERRNNAET